MDEYFSDDESRIPAVKPKRTKALRGKTIARRKRITLPIHQKPHVEFLRVLPLKEMDNHSKGNSPEQTSPASGDETDVSPPSTEQVSESGNFADQWIDSKCVFCQQELKDINEPKLLNCLHTACKACLNSESAPSPAPTSTGLGLTARQLVCPVCNQEVNLNDVVDHLFLLEHLSQNCEGLPEESKNYPCSCDEGADATGFCTNCKEWLCEACVTAHHRVRVTKDHNICPKDVMEDEKAMTGLSQKYLFCPVHSHEPLKLYCESCDKLTCRDCQLSDHKEHKYQFLTDACKDEKNSLNLILQKIKEKQQHIETACSLVNKRHQEISQRENSVTQEVKTFAVKFITEINKRGKQLLQELSEVCVEKKTQLSFKNEELVNMSRKLDYCKKFSEAALGHGSETALVYSKKLIIGQLKRILKHRCEVPNPSHNVDITFSFEGNYLTQYISTLGTLLVDQQPVPRVSLSTTPQQQQPPPPQPPLQQQQQLQPTRIMQQQQPVMHQNTPNLPLSRQMNQQQLVSVNRNTASIAHMNQQMQMQQKQMQMQQKQQMHRQNQQMQFQQKQQLQKQQSHYGQAQVTSSTDTAQNRNIQQGNMRQVMSANVNMQTFPRSQAQRSLPSNVAPNQNQNFPVSNNNYMQRHVAPQQTPARQVPVQQYNNPGVPVPLAHNSNITISPIGGPTPPKQQRVVAPRQNIQLSPISNQKSGPQRQQQRVGQPQVIEIDGDGPAQKTPTMSNTTRLTHFPAAAAAISALPELQLQPINNSFHNNSGTIIPTNMLMPDEASWMDCSENPTSQSMCMALVPVDAVTSLDQFANAIIDELSVPSQFNATEQEFESNKASSQGQLVLTIRATQINSLQKSQEECETSNLKEVQVQRTKKTTGLSKKETFEGCETIASNSANKTNLSKKLHLVEVTVDTLGNESAVIHDQATSISETSASKTAPSVVKDSSLQIEKHLNSCHQAKTTDAEPKCIGVDSALDNSSFHNDSFCVTINDSDTSLVNSSLSLVDSDESLDSFPVLEDFCTKRSDSRDEEQQKPVPKISILLSDPNDDYCAVCKDGGKLVCCSRCPRVYHSRCHVPTLLEVPKDEWICRMCEDVTAYTPKDNTVQRRKQCGLNGRNLICCERILLELLCHELSSPFHTKIERSTPGYYTIIKEPMHLDYIRFKFYTDVNNYKNISEFLTDIKLMFSNCVLYNGKESRLYNVAKELEEFFASLLKKYFPGLAYDKITESDKSAPSTKSIPTPS